MATMQEIETWRGRTLYDRDGDKIGTIEDIYLDRNSGEPEWVAVKTGLFGSNMSFVPIRDASAHGDDVRVHDLKREFDAVLMERAPNAVPTSVAMEREFKWLHTYRPAGFGWMTQDLHPSGAVGDASAASAERGEAALAFGASAFVDLLAEVDRFDLARLEKGPLG